MNGDPVRDQYLGRAAFIQKPNMKPFRGKVAQLPQEPQSLEETQLASKKVSLPVPDASVSLSVNPRRALRPGLGD